MWRLKKVFLSFRFQYLFRPDSHSYARPLTFRKENHRIFRNAADSSRQRKQKGRTFPKMDCLYDYDSPGSFVP